MNEQINLRMPATLLKAARQKAKSKGHRNVQEYIAETIREDIYDDYVLSKKEIELIDRLMKAKGDPRIWGTEQELQAAFKRAKERKSGSI
jgi:lipoate-protein ligase A